MSEFDLCGPLPRGVTLLEASAGTGKTFAIAALVARLVEAQKRVNEPFPVRRRPAQERANWGVT